MRRVAATLVLIGLILGGMVLSIAAPGSSQTADPPAASTATGFHLREVTNWIGPEGTFRAVVDTAALPSGTSIGVTLHQAVNDRPALDRAIRGDRLGSTLFTATTIAATTPTTEIAFPVTDRWPQPTDGTVIDTPGVYPVVITAADRNGERVASLTTFLIRLPVPTSITPPLAVGLVVEQRQPQTLDADGGPTLDPAAAIDLFDSLRVLDASPTLPLTLLPSATTIVEGNEVASPADSAALATLRMGPTRLVLASTYAPIPLDSWVDASLTGEIDRQFAFGRTAIAQTIGTAPESRLAVLDPSIGPSGLDVLRAHDTSEVIVPSAQLVADPRTTPAPTRAFDVRSASGARLRAIAADSAISTRLLDRVDPIAAAHNAIADLALIGLADRSAAQGLAVVVPGTTDPATLRALLDALSTRDGSAAGQPGAPLLSPVRLDDLFTVTDATISYETGRAAPIIRPITAAEPAPLGTYPDDLRATLRTIDGLLTMVPDAPSLAGNAVHRALASGDRSLSDPDRDRVLASAGAAVRSITDEIVMTPEQIVTLTSRSGKVPLNIENRLTVPARVHVSLRSAKLDFPDGAEIDLVLAPATTTRIDARVTTRASGAFPLDVVVATADTTVPVTRARFTVRSTAISGIGLLISIGAGLFLALWWIRHYRTNRRASRLVAATHPSQSPERSEAGARSPGADDYAPPNDSNLGEP